MLPDSGYVHHFFSRDMYLRVHRQEGKKMLMEEENQVHNPGKLVNCDMCVGHVSHEYVRRPVGLQWGWGMLGVEFVQERGNMQCVCLQQYWDLGKDTREQEWMERSLKTGVNQ